MRVRKEYNLPVEDQPANLSLRIEDSILYCKRYNVDTAVFRNENSFHFIREHKFCEPGMDIKFVALAKFCRGVKNEKYKNSRKNEEPPVG